MELQAGDRITHPAMPAWGLGQVIGSPAGNTVRVFFVGAGEKVISLDHVTLVRVTGIEAANALLDYLRVDDSGTVIRYRSLPDSIAYFLKEYPGGFYGEKFLTQEREYKIAAHRLTRELLAKSDSHRLLSRDIDEFIQRALRVVNATNLIFPNEKMSLRDGLGEASRRRSFAQALFELLHGTQPLEHRFTKFAGGPRHNWRREMDHRKLLFVPLFSKRLCLPQAGGDPACRTGVRLRDPLPVRAEL